ncbi:MAG: phosphoribosylglycinamide formyltransferase [Pseudomonadales bacterium]|jgi:phosphoribosylglycinamide formyltransferase-1
MTKNLRLAVLASGRGSHLENVDLACQNQSLPATVSLVASDQATSGAMQYAESRGIATVFLDRRTLLSPDASDQYLADQLEAHAIDWVLCLGYLKRIGPQVVSAYKDKMINVHPSLLPKFGGRGMYGLAVHQAVLDAGETETGATVHFVNEAYDEGAIIAQIRVTIPPKIDSRALAALVLKAEHQLVLNTLSRLFTDHD